MFVKTLYFSNSSCVAVQRNCGNEFSRYTNQRQFTNLLKSLKKQEMYVINVAYLFVWKKLHQYNIGGTKKKFREKYLTFILTEKGLKQCCKEKLLYL
jgi:hypothetical protein